MAAATAVVATMAAAAAAVAATTSRHWRWLCHCLPLISLPPPPLRPPLPPPCPLLRSRVLWCRLPFRAAAVAAVAAVAAAVVAAVVAVVAAVMVQDFAKTNVLPNAKEKRKWQYNGPKKVKKCWRRKMKVGKHRRNDTYTWLHIY